MHCASTCIIVLVVCGIYAHEVCCYQYSFLAVGNVMERSKYSMSLYLIMVCEHIYEGCTPNVVYYRE